jgi:hypothetical protein
VEKGAASALGSAMGFFARPAKGYINGIKNVQKMLT